MERWYTTMLRVEGSAGQRRCRTPGNLSLVFALLMALAACRVQALCYPPSNSAQLSRSRPIISRISLSMHGNHGGHHHHEYENEDTQSLRSDAESRFGRVISDKIAIRIFSSTAATLAMPQLYPSIYRQVSNQGRRVALTFLTSFVGMWAWDSLKSSANTYIDKFSKLQSSLVKHSTPLTRKFFFRNENAADKVTLLGIFVNVLLSISKFWGGYYVQ